MGHCTDHSQQNPLDLPFCTFIYPEPHRETPQTLTGSCFVWHREQDRSLTLYCCSEEPKPAQRNRMIPMQPWKSGQALEWAGRWGWSHPWMSKERLDMALVEKGIDPSLDSMLWKVFSKLDDSGMLLSGMERARTWIWAAQRGTALPAMGHSLFPGISAK